MKNQTRFFGIILLIFSLNIHAEIVEVRATGTLSKVDDPFGMLSDASIGRKSTFTVSIAYDSSQQPTSISLVSGSEQARYDEITTTATIDGVYNFTVYRGFQIYNSPGRVNLRDAFLTSIGTSVYADFAFPAHWHTLDFRLYDPKGAVFTDTSLPTNLNLKDFQTKTLLIRAQDEAGVIQYSFEGKVTDLMVNVTP